MHKNITKRKYRLQNSIIVLFQFYLKIMYIHQTINRRISSVLVFKGDSFYFILFVITLIFYFDFIFIEFIGVALVNKVIYRYQVQNSIICHLYTVLCVHHPSPVSCYHHLSSLYLLLTLPTPFTSVSMKFLSFFFC